MSVHLTVPNKSMVNRSKVLLTDVQAAKKQEWERRRKLRLQQVRQQAKDLACSILNRVRAEEKDAGKKELARKEKELRERQRRELEKCQKDFKECISGIGQGHQSAKEQVLAENVLLEQRQLLSEISKARGALAAERLKAEKQAIREKEEAAARCRELARNIENSRAAPSLAKPLPTERASRKPCPAKIERSENVKNLQQKTPIKETSKTGRNPVLKGVLKKPGTAKHPLRDTTNENERRSPQKSRLGKIPRDTDTVLLEECSPIKQKENTSCKSTGFALHPNSEIISNSGVCRKLLSPQSSSCECFICGEKIKRNLSCHGSSERFISSTNGHGESSPRKVQFNSSAVGYESDDSDSSTTTWPLRTPSKAERLSTDSQKVELYDHSGRLCKEYVRPANSVVYIGPESRKDYIGDEGLDEECGKLSHKKLDELDRKRIERGRKALRKNCLRADFEKMIQELKAVDKAERLKGITQRKYLACTHMCDERLKEKEQLRQYRLEKAFEPLYESVCKDSGKSTGETIQESPSKKNSTDRKTIVVDNLTHKERFSGQSKYSGETGSLILKSERALRLLIQKVHKQREDLMGSANENDRSRKSQEMESSDDIEIPQWIMEDPLPAEKSTGGESLDSSRDADPSSSSSEAKVERVEVEAMVHDPPPEVSGKSDRQKRTPQTKKPPDRVPGKASSTPEKRRSKKVESDKSTTSSGGNDSSLEKSQEKVSKEESTNDISLPLGSNEVEGNSKESSSFEGIEVVVSVREKKASKVKGKDVNRSLKSDVTDGKRIGSKRWDERIGVKEPSSSSTSYMSPPENLNPSQLNLLNSVLSRVRDKNENPRLREYVSRLLKMSRESIEELSVSSTDVSVRSDLIYSLDNSINAPPPTFRSDSSDRVPHVPCETLEMSRTDKEFQDEVERPVPPVRGDSRAQQRVQSYAAYETENNGNLAHYYELAERYTDRISALARMINSCHLSGRYEKNVNESSYLSIPSDLSGSVKISDSVKEDAEAERIVRPDQSVLQDSFVTGGQPLGWNLRQPQTTAVHRLREEDVTLLGLSMNILPKPCDVNGAGPARRAKPPPVLQAAQRRPGFPLTVPHELSTIEEIETSASQITSAVKEAPVRTFSPELLRLKEQFKNSIESAATDKNVSPQHFAPKPVYSGNDEDRGASQNKQSDHLKSQTDGGKTLQKQYYSLEESIRQVVRKQIYDKMLSNGAKGETSTTRPPDSTPDTTVKTSPIDVSYEESFVSIRSDFDSDLSSVRGPSPNEFGRENLADFSKTSDLNVNPDREGENLNDSSLSLLSSVSDFSLLSEKELNKIMDSSSDDFEDIFRSLGIGWALATLRKTKEAKKLSLDTSSSSSSATGQRPSEKTTSQSSKYLHSTPVKRKAGGRGQSDPSGSFGTSAPSSVTPLWSSDSLTPPSLTLSTRHLDLQSTLARPSHSRK